MNRSARVLAPYVAAFFLPAIVLGGLFAASGDTPLYGLFGGGVGLIGALTALATRVLLAPTMTESEVEALARELDEEEDWRDTAPGARARELGFCCEAGATAYPGLCPWHGETRDEPPERG
jgi:hypothetical protein